MKPEGQPAARRESHELSAFFVFFGCVLGASVILYQIFRLLVPSGYFEQYSQIFATLAFLICGGGGAWVANELAKAWHKWPFD